MLVVVAIMLAVVLLAVVALFGLVFQLTRQQGTLLLRLDELEQALEELGDAAGGRPDPVRVGVAAPDFELRDLSGQSVRLRDFAGRRLLAIHWSPTCGFCARIASDLAGLQDDLQGRRTDLVLVASGDAEANRALADEHGLRATILLEQNDPPRMFAGFGTPVAYLLDDRGRVAKPCAIGAPDVLALATEAARGRRALAIERPLSESKLVRDGLPAGTPAPEFTLPDLQGADVSLGDFRGRSVLLVFSDRSCGPCRELLPQLQRFASESEGRVEVVLVTRGTVEENRTDETYLRCPFPVVTQRGWSLSKEYGIFATPVAYLIDSNGVIARNVARGVDEIVSLGRDTLDAGREEAPVG